MLHPSLSAQNLNRRVSKNIDLVHKKKTQCTIEMHICKLLNLLSGMVIHEVIINKKSSNIHLSHCYNAVSVTSALLFPYKVLNKYLL